MKNINEFQNYFIIKEFDEGWGMEDVDSIEQLYIYCMEVLFIPEEKIEDLNLDYNNNLEIILKDLEVDDTTEDWYVNLRKISKD